MSRWIPGEAANAATFWDFVSPEPNSGCWLWMGRCDRDGYGYMHVKGTHSSVRAHRFAWVADRGAIPIGLWVLHRCDNPSCVNPDHLFLGTATDNARDMARKGRHRCQVHPGQQAHGEDHPDAKLTEADVLSMREMNSEGVGYRRLASVYGLNKATVRAAIKGITWRHVGSPR